ncbi:hypothetical protein ACQWFV_26595, partial [Salmonella enterica subsp. enterica serovar Infantis]
VGPAWPVDVDICVGPDSPSDPALPMEELLSTDNADCDKRIDDKKIYGFFLNIFIISHSVLLG